MSMSAGGIAAELPRARFRANAGTILLCLGRAQNSQHDNRRAPNSQRDNLTPRNSRVAVNALMSWQRLKRDTVVDSPWLRVFRDTYQLPAGRVVDDYYIVERSDFVVVVASVGESVALVRQYRPGTDTYYWSLPAGYIGQGEAPELAAIRELREETGLVAEDARLLMTLDPLPGYLKSSAGIVRCHCSEGPLVIEDTEEITEARFVTWPAVLDMITGGQIVEMQAVSALLLALQFETR
jgi:8-oxo-dGTP pyrophosphatase MutT (NUDIX family)